MGEIFDRVTKAVEAARDKWCKEAGSWNADITPAEDMARAAIVAVRDMVTEGAGDEALDAAMKIDPQCAYEGPAPHLIVRCALDAILSKPPTT